MFAVSEYGEEYGVASDEDSKGSYDYGYYLRPLPGGRLWDSP